MVKNDISHLTVTEMGQEGSEWGFLSFPFVFFRQHMYVTPFIISSYGNTFTGFPPKPKKNIDTPHKDHHSNLNKPQSRTNINTLHGLPLFAILRLLEHLRQYIITPGNHEKVIGRDGLSTGMPRISMTRHIYPPCKRLQILPQRDCG